MAQPNVRTYYKLIQCLHHQTVSKHQQAGNWSKAFLDKNKQLIDFIRPAYPNQKITNKVKTITTNWTNQIINSLHTHYTEGIAELTAEIEKLQDNTAKETALTRAKRHFGKKLKLETIKSFNKICQNNSSEPSNIQTNENSRNQDTNARKHGYNTRLNATYVHPSNTNNPKEGTHKTHTRSSNKQKWKMDNITHKTLIMGDSNLKSIKKTVDDVKVESFPGAKFHNITNLVKEYPNAAYKPKNLIVNVGLNNYHNKTQPSKQQIDKMCTALKSKFPDTRIFIPQVNIPEDLPQFGIENLHSINEYLKTKLNHITVIPKLSQSKFTLAADGYHWTQFTGNQFLNHWLAHLN